MKKIIYQLSPSTRLVLYKQFYSSIKCQKLLFKILKSQEWKAKKIKIFGKEILEPRLTSFVADKGTNYKYSGVDNYGLGWPVYLNLIKRDIQRVSKHEFNSLLLNLYRDGQDSMGWHRDNEKSLGLNPIVASLSLGGERNFVFRKYKSKTNKTKLVLSSGDLLIMEGKFQTEWEHCIPKEKNVKDLRLNLTFRSIRINTL